MKTDYILAGLLLILLGAFAALLFLLFHRPAALKPAHSQTARPAQQTVAAAPVPPKPASQEELIAAEQAELTPLFGEEHAATLAKLDANLTARAAVGIMGQQYIEYKYLSLKETDEAAANQAVKTDLDAFHAILQKHAAIRQENYKKEQEYTAYLTKQWHATLPLYKKNLTFKGPDGEEPAQHSETDCPPTLQGYQIKGLVCLEYRYPNGAKSIFYFQRNFLRGRDDFRPDETVRARRLFFPVPSYTFRARPEETLAARGMVYVEELYDQEHALPHTVSFYAPDGTVQETVLRDFQKNREQHPAYDMNWQHRLSSYHTINTADGTVAHHHTSIGIRLDKNDRDPAATQGTYERSVSHNGKRELTRGTWQAKEDNTIVLDSGKTFAPADQLPRSRSYCEIYPAGCKKKL